MVTPNFFRSIRRKLEQPKIEFVCDPTDRGVIADPIVSKSHMPEWFRRLPAIDNEQVNAGASGQTIKRCMPFLDVMTTGWIIPLAATVRLQIRDNGCTVDASWDFDRDLVSNHGAFQVAGNPKEPRPPCKFHNYWTIITPPGWSCLFIPPANRPHPVFETISGIVDTDTYRSLVNFPFFATAADGNYTLERGTPLVQVIPFKRETASIEGVIRAEEPEESAERERIRRSTKAAEGWYRKFARAPR